MALLDSAAAPLEEYYYMYCSSLSTKLEINGIENYSFVLKRVSPNIYTPASLKRKRVAAMAKRAEIMELFCDRHCGKIAGIRVWLWIFSHGHYPEDARDNSRYPSHAQAPAGIGMLSDPSDDRPPDRS